eukprot:g3571.t1
MVKFCNLKHHKKIIHHCAFSSNARRLLTSSEDKTCIVWNAITGELIKILIGHDAGVLMGVYSSDDEFIATASKDSTVKIWNAQTWTVVHTLRGHCGYVRAVRFSPDIQLIATASDDRTCVLWETSTYKPLGHFEHIDYIHDCAFSPDGSMLATASRDKTAKLWDLRSLKQVHTLTGHTGFVWSCSFSQDGEVLITASEDKSCKLWHVNEGVCVLTLSGHYDEVNSCTYADNCDMIATASDDNTVRLWDYVTGKEMHVVKDHEDRVTSIAFSGKGALLASSSKDCTTKVYSVNAVMPPSCEVSGPKTELQVGCNLVLSAQVSGQPPPALKWYKDDTKLPTKDYKDSTTLRISNINKWHDGIYTCVATNQFGTAKSSYRLHVTDFVAYVDKTEKDLEKISEELHKTEESLVLADETIESDSKRIIEIKQNMEELQHGVSEAELQIKSLQDHIKELQDAENHLRHEHAETSLHRKEATKKKKAAEKRRSELLKQQNEKVVQHKQAVKQLNDVNGIKRFISACNAVHAEEMISQVTDPLFEKILDVQNLALTKLQTIARDNFEDAIDINAETVAMYCEKVKEEFPLAIVDLANTVRHIFVRLLPDVRVTLASNDIVKLLSLAGYKEYVKMDMTPYILDVTTKRALPLLEEKEGVCRKAVEGNCHKTIANFDLSKCSESCRTRTTRVLSILLHSLTVSKARTEGDAKALLEILQNFPCESVLLSICLTLCDDKFAIKAVERKEVDDALQAALTSFKLANSSKQLQRLSTLAQDLYQLALWLIDNDRSDIFSTCLEMSMPSLHALASYVDAAVLEATPFSLKSSDAKDLGFELEKLRTRMGVLLE